MLYVGLLCSDFCSVVGIVVGIISIFNINVLQVYDISFIHILSQIL